MTACETDKVLVKITDILARIAERLVEIETAAPAAAAPSSHGVKRLPRDLNRETLWLQNADGLVLTGTQREMLALAENINAMASPSERLLGTWRAVALPMPAAIRVPDMPADMPRTRGRLTVFGY